MPHTHVGQVATCLALVLGLAACRPSAQPSPSEAASSETPQISPAQLESQLDAARRAATWVYTDKPDRMLDHPMHTACVSARDLVEAKDDNGSEVQALPSICVRRAADSTVRVWLSTSAGTFNCPPPYGCMIKARVDALDPKSIWVGAPADMPEQLVLIDPSQATSMLKTGRRLLIEAPLTGAGAQQFELNIANFDVARMEMKLPADRAPADMHPAASSESVPTQADAVDPS